MTPAEIRAAVQKQLDRPLDKILNIVESRPTLAEQRERIAFGERCLWGASMIMAAIGMQVPSASEPTSSEPLAISWWMLFDVVEATRARWPGDERADWDTDRYARRQAIWDEVRSKLAEQQGIAYAGRPYAADVQRSTDEPPRQKFTLDVRYGQEKGRLDVRDPFNGDWLDIASKEAPPTWRAIAKDNWLRDKASREPNPPPRGRR